MDASCIIRDEIDEVEKLRKATSGAPSLTAAVSAVKRFQSVRFEVSYRDLLHGGPYQAAARFFLRELYGDTDYAERDAQFARIAGAIQKLLPKHAAATAVALARLHGLTEQLDHVMGVAWESDGNTDNDNNRRYVRAWRATARRNDRYRQLRLVLQIGQDLGTLTQTPGLRLMLKMMRRPARAAGLPELQNFLEQGFDTFAAMGKNQKSVQSFLQLVEARETKVIETLFTPDYNECSILFSRLMEIQD